MSRLVAQIDEVGGEWGVSAEHADKSSIRAVVEAQDDDFGGHSEVEATKVVDGVEMAYGHFGRDMEFFVMVGPEESVKQLQAQFDRHYNDSDLTIEDVYRRLQ
jgi:hypothetical protein